MPTRTVRALLLLSLTLPAAGCGPSSSPAPATDDTLPDLGGGADDAQPASEFQRRQWEACDRLAPKLTACAVADLANATPEERAEADVENTAPIHTREMKRTCRGWELSSRQLRVLEVCEREESECAALAACLENLEAPAGS